MRRLFALGSATAVAATSLLLLTPGDAHAAKPVSTPYVLRGYGYGLRVLGGSLPASSGDTAAVSSGCMNKAGVSRENHLAGATLPDKLGSIGAVTSRTWTTKVGGTVNRYTRSKVADITLARSGLGKLSIQGLTVTAHVWHDAKGFHSEVVPDVARIAVTDPITGTHSAPLPTPGNPLKIPGLATLSMGAKSTHRGPNWAGANSDGLRLYVAPSNTTLALAHAWAYMSEGVESGIFGGSAAAIRASALGSLASVGPQPLLLMPCKSPKGKTLTKAIAGLPLSNVGVPIKVGALTSQMQGNQSGRKAWGRAISRVASVNIGNGALVVKGLVAQANVTRTGKGLTKLTRNASGTTVGSITANGTSYSLAQLDGKKIDIPGGALSIQTKVVTNQWQGIQVVGLRITVLSASDVTKTVIDLGRARLKIAKP